MDTSFCLDVLDDALRNGGQRSSTPTRGAIHQRGVYRQAGSRGRAHQHGWPRALVGQRVRRALWRSLKCEEVHLKAGACPRTGRRPAPWPMVSRRVSASTNGYASTTRADRTKPWVTRHRRQRGRPRSALWICRCARTTLARRPQPHRANDSRPWSTFDEEGERPSPYQRAPCGPESRVHRSRAAHDIEPKLSKSAFHCSLKFHDYPSRLLNGSIWRRQWSGNVAH